VRLLELIASALRALKDGADARTQLELALVKAATPDLEPSVKALLARLERLENRAPAPAPARHALTPETAAGRAATTAAPPAPPARDDVAAPAPAPAYGASPAPVGRTAVAVTAQVEGQPPVAAATTLPGAPAVGAEEAQRVADQAAAQVAAEIATADDPSPAVAAVAVIDPGATGTEPTFSAGVELSLEEFGGVWPAVVDSLRAEAPMLASLLEDAQPAALADQGLTLAWPESSAFLKRKAEDPTNRDLIAGAIRAVTGSSLRLAYELRADHEVVSPAAAAGPALSEEELVQRFMDEFEAEELPPEPEEQT
jgi:DNA polymerase-3 subunit gamma/tau